MWNVMVSHHRGYMCVECNGESPEGYMCVECNGESPCVWNEITADKYSFL